MSVIVCMNLDNVMPASHQLKPGEWPKPVCSAITLEIMEGLGQPPKGAYFWTERKGEGWCLQVCYDTRNEAHRNYAQALLLLSQPDLLTLK